MREGHWRQGLRAILEFLGIVEPERGHREPVALPAWSRMGLVLLVPVLAVASALLAVVVRTLVG